MQNENNPVQWNPEEGGTGSSTQPEVTNPDVTSPDVSSNVSPASPQPHVSGVPQPVVPVPVVPSPSAPAPSASVPSDPVTPLTPPVATPVMPSVSAPSGSAQEGKPVSIEDDAPGSGEFNNNYQRFAESAGKQMEEAADAIRRGEFVRDAVVDPAADSDDRLVGLLNYVVPVLLPAIVLMSESSEKRPFQRFHAVQSLGLSAAMILAGIVVGIVSMVLGVIPVINIIAAVALFCLTPVLFLMAIVAVIYYGVQAYQGKRFTIPGVTNFLINQGWL